MDLAENSTSRPATTWVLLAGLVATAVVLAWGGSRSPDLAFDDAYITYRYADNLRQGLGLVYNPGEWVLGTTTPLFALLLGMLGLLAPQVEVIGHWAAVLGWIAATWAAIALLWQAQWRRAGLVAGLLLAFEASFLPSLGMETPVLVALMLTVAWVWLGGRKWLAVPLGTALLLTRQDSALWLLLLGLEVWRRERVLPWREALGTILLSLPWFAFAWWRYGSILPNSAGAKFGQNELMPVSGQSAFWQMLWEAGTAGLHPAVIGISIAVLLLGIWIIVRHARTFWWLAAWTVLYVLIYTWLQVVSFPWYFVPPLAAMTLIMALGFGYLLGDGRAERREQESTKRRLVSSRILLATLGGLLVIVLLLNRGVHMRAIRTHRGYRPAYTSVGQWLSDNSPADSQVAAIEIGVIGYLSRRPILDTMGLVSPDMTRHQVGWVETIAYALNVHQPDYAVTLPETAWDPIVATWWFQKQYERVAHFSEVTIYQHREVQDDLLGLPFQLDFVDGLSLTGAQVNSWTIQPGMSLEVWLHVDVESPPPSRYLFTLYLMDAQTYEHLAATTFAPLDGYYPSLRWQAGDQLALPMRLEVPNDLQPGTYRLGVTVFDTEREAGLPLREQPNVPDPDLHLGWFRLGSPPPPPGRSAVEEQPLQALWQDGIQVTGVGLPSQPLAPGDVLPVQFVWKTSQPVSRDLTVFVHLVDAQGEIVAQVDRRPFDGRWPTPAWQPGEVLQDTYEATLPDTLPAGRYGLRFGFYDETGRLVLADGSADYWLLPDAVEVTQQPYCGHRWTLE
jgi:hypothetical protein